MKNQPEEYARTGEVEGGGVYDPAIEGHVAAAQPWAGQIQAKIQSCERAARAASGGLRNVAMADFRPGLNRVRELAANMLDE